MKDIKIFSSTLWKYSKPTSNPPYPGAKILQFHFDSKSYARAKHRGDKEVNRCSRPFISRPINRTYGDKGTHSRKNIIRPTRCKQIIDHCWHHQMAGWKTYKKNSKFIQGPCLVISFIVHPIIDFSSPLKNASFEGKLNEGEGMHWKLVIKVKTNIKSFHDSHLTHSLSQVSPFATRPAIQQVSPWRARPNILSSSTFTSAAGWTPSIHPSSPV